MISSAIALYSQQKFSWSMRIDYSQIDSITGYTNLWHNTPPTVTQGVNDLIFKRTVRFPPSWYGLFSQNTGAMQSEVQIGF